MTDSSESLRLPTLNELIARVDALHPDADPITHLVDAVTVGAVLTEHADHLVGHFVDAARAAGASWSQIGEGLGVSKQAVQQRFVPREPGSVADFEHSFTLPTKGRFRRYTDRAKHCVVAAEEIAAAVGNPEVGPVHLLLGLYAEPEGLACRMIAALANVPPEQIRRAALDALPAPDPAANGLITFRAEGKKVVDLAVREALRLGHNYVGTEHLLLALLSDGVPESAGLLAEAGLTHERALAEFDALFAAHIERTRAGKQGGAK